MEEKLKNNIVHPLDPWIILLGLISFIVILLSAMAFINPAISGVTLGFLLMVIYLFNQYGPISFTEFLPGGKDYVVLAIGLIMIFWKIGLVVGKEGIKADPELIALTGFQYGFEVATLISIGPLLEEIFLRRYFYEMLATMYSREMAVGLTVCISSLLHWHPAFTWIEFFWHLSSALIYTIAYLMSRLGVSVLLHSFNNFLAFVLMRA